MAKVHPNLVISPSKAHRLLFTKMRDVGADCVSFQQYAKRSMRLLAEDALAEFPCEEVEVTTPCGPCKGIQNINPDNIVATSIIRSGDALLEAVRDVEPGVRVGKILIQRDEEHPDKIAKLFYSKMPPGVERMHILLCDPMLATGGSALLAIKCLIEKHQVDPSKIIFANMICAPEGLKAMAESYPQIKIVSVIVDECLNDVKFIVPGLGDFGDRFFNTE